MHKTIFRPWQVPNVWRFNMENLVETLLRMVRRARQEPMVFDANATVRIESKLLDLGSTDHGTFPYLP